LRCRSSASTTAHEAAVRKAIGLKENDTTNLTGIERRNPNMVIATSNALVPKSGGLMLGCIEAANFVRFLAIYEIYNSTYSCTTKKKGAHFD
jgi:hypothetical protein